MIRVQARFAGTVRFIVPLLRRDAGVEGRGTCEAFLLGLAPAEEAAAGVLRRREVQAEDLLERIAATILAP